MTTLLVAEIHDHLIQLEFTLADLTETSQALISCEELPEEIRDGLEAAYSKALAAKEFWADFERSTDIKNMGPKSRSHLQSSIISDIRAAENSLSRLDQAFAAYITGPPFKNVCALYYQHISRYPS